MQKLILSGLACAGLLLAIPDTGYAHGGKYRGPGDVVPPNPGGGGGRTPGPSGPSTPGPGGPATPGPAGPSTPGPAGPAGGGAAPAAAGPRTGGIPITADIGRWQFWWEFNKDPFINLKEAIHSATVKTGSDEFFMGGSRRAESKDTMKPTESEIMGRILPALKRALDQTDNNDIVSSCLVAMAKIGKDHENFKILDIIKPHLESRNQEIRETAAVSMGISQMPEAIDDLVALAKNTPAGRALCKRQDVDARTRSFACYGLGLIAYATTNTDHKRTCYETLRDILKESTSPMSDRNVPIAAINGLRLVRPNASGSEKDTQLFNDCLDTLFTYYTKKTGQGEQQVQAHVPAAIAQTLGRGGDTTGKYKDRFADELTNKHGKLKNERYQSAVLALGILCESEEENKDDAKYSKALLKYFGSGKDEQARSFCLMSLAKIGGNANRNELLKAFDKGSKAVVKPWAAVSLGVLAYNAAEASGENAVMDKAIGRALHNQLDKIKNDQTQSAIAVALGLVKYREAADLMQRLMLRYKHKDEFAGYVCIGLALMGDTRSMDSIRTLVQNSIRRPELLQQAAIALGKMGDKSVTDILHDMLKDPSKQNVASLSSISAALGFIGDRRTIDPLIKMLHDESITPLSRAFAAVALGGVSDKESLPWNSKIAVDMNYRAAVETLTDQVAGILDIL